MTINIALNLRTTTQLFPYNDGMLVIESDEFGFCEYSEESLDFTGIFGLILAILSHFNVTGVKVKVTAEAPFQSGLEGSAALAVALISSLLQCLKELKNCSMPPLRERAL